MINQDTIDRYSLDWAFDAPIKLASSPEIYNVDVINQSIEMILTTPIGSRLFNINFGSNFSLRIFDNMTTESLQDVLDDTMESIDRWEDRITIFRQQVVLEADIDRQVINLTIPYIINQRKIKGEFSKIIRA